MLYRLGWLLSKILYGVLWSPRVVGAEHIPDGPFLLCPTHRSWFDPPLVGSRLRRPIAYMAKKELFSFPVAGWILRSVHAIPVRRGSVDRAAIDLVLEKLSQNMPVLVFPEGTRSRTGKMLPPRPGIGLLAHRAKVPIVPVFIGGTFHLSRILFHWGRLTVRFGAPITPQEIAAHPDTKDGYRAISWLVMQRICNLGDAPVRLWEEARERIGTEDSR